MQAEFARFPRQVERIDWNAMPPQTGPRPIGDETKWFGRRSTNDFMHVNPHPVAYDLHFVGQPDIHGPMNVFQ